MGRVRKSPGLGKTELYATLDEEERRRLDRLADLLASRGSLDEKSLAGLLPAAMERRAAEDGLLAEAMARPTVEAIGISVNRQPEELSTQLFPIIGSIIRKSLATYFQNISEEIDRKLAKGLSFETLRLKLESRRRGIPYYELLVARTLAYKVERVFLIRAGSGLLLAEASASADGAPPVDPDQVGAMLVAIREFARDSFKRGGEDEGLSAIEMGGSKLIIVEGPLAILALAVRGTPNLALRHKAEESLELIHFKFGAAIKAFSGDPEGLQRLLPILDGCLAEEERPRGGGKKIYSGLLFGLLGALLFLLVALGAARGIAAASVLRRLDSIPGLRLESSERRGASLVLRGLRDPLAEVPELSSLGRPWLRLEGSFEPYISFEPAMVEIRARRSFELPGTVSLELGEGRLLFRGTASAAWRARAEAAPSVLRELYRLDFSGLGASAEARARVAASYISFDPNSSLIRGQEEVLRGLAAGFRELAREAADRGQAARLVLVGYQYEAGGIGGGDLRSARAAAVRESLLALGLEPREIVTETAQAAQASETAGRPERRVDFRVEIAAAVP